MAVSTDGSIITTYCEPVDVCKAIRIIDLYDVNEGILEPSDVSLPDYDELCQRITVAEKFIDRYTGRSWRENRVRNQIMDVNTYWHDINARRAEYWQQGGYYLQLHKDVLSFDPSKGDKLEVRTLDNQWVDISGGFLTYEKAQMQFNELEKRKRDEYTENGQFWFNYKDGLLYLRLGFYQTKQNSLRISYRWGDVEEVPPDIKRACALKVGLTLLNEELYMTRLGSGGDLGSNKSDMKRGMQDEINEILLANRTFTGMYSAYD